MQQGVGGAIELRRGDDVLSGLRDIGEGGIRRRRAGGGADPAGRAFQRRHPRLQHGHRRVGDAAVAIALLFEIEQRGAMIGGVELISRRLIDRHRHRPGRGVGFKTGMQGERFVAHESPRRLRDRILSIGGLTKSPYDGRAMFVYRIPPLTPLAPAARYLGCSAVSIRDSMNQHLAAKEPSASRAWLRALEMTARIEDAPARIFPVVVEELGARFGDVPAIIGSAQTWSHAQLAARANRYARWALAQGIAKDDTVALLLGNCPDYLAIWLGITRIGGLAALLNINLSGEALSHCLRVAQPKHIIAGEGLADGLTATVPVWRLDGDFSRVIEGFSGTLLTEADQRAVSLNDPALLIYTSGTTGLPKAAYVSHRRVMNWTHWFAGMTGAGP